MYTFIFILHLMIHNYDNGFLDGLLVHKKQFTFIKIIKQVLSILIQIYLSSS